MIDIDIKYLKRLNNSFLTIYRKLNDNENFKNNDT